MGINRNKKRGDRYRPSNNPVRPVVRAKLEAIASGCAKVAYMNKGAAMAGLRVVRSVRRHERAYGVSLAGKGERSAYHCKACGQWHLTSQKKRGQA